MNEYRQKLLENLGVEKTEKELRPRFWFTISMVPNIGDEFIREFADKLDWPNVSRIQKLSDDLIYELKHYINWNNYFIYNEANFSIIKQFILKTNFRKLDNFKSSHLTNSQKQEIRKLLDFKFIFEK